MFDEINNPIQAQAAGKRKTVKQNVMDRPEQLVNRDAGTSTPRLCDD